MKVKVEVCVTSVSEALAAEQAGADGVEICAWLASGGITPSYGLVNTLNERLRIPLRVLVRPRPGDFRYSNDERQAMLRDAMLIGMSGVGIVTGALDPHGLPEQQLLKGVRLAASENEVTFHRAIDHASDLGSAFHDLLTLDVQRVLTSGGRTLASDGIPVIAAMVAEANGRVLVAAAGGINPANVAEIVQRTGVPEVHFAAQRFLAVEPDGKASLSSQHMNASFATEPDVAKIEGVLNALVKAGLR